MSSRNPICVWDVTVPHTINNEEISHDFLIDLFKTHCKKWCFQLEQGSETGYLHYQCRISLNTKARKPNIFPFKGINYTPTSEEHQHDFNYTSKELTRVKGPWSHENITFKTPRQIREIEELYPWQQSIIDDRLVWNTRTINILYDPTGNNGKSILKTFIGVHGLGRALPFLNDYKDIMRMVMCTKKVPLYIIDIPRALRKDQLYGFFSGIETLKDGYAYDDRYHFKEEYFDCPNIWVFMNTIPDTTYLSKDRWKFWAIKERRLVKMAATPVTLSFNQPAQPEHPDLHPLINLE